MPLQKDMPVALDESLSLRLISRAFQYRKNHAEGGKKAWKAWVEKLAESIQGDVSTEKDVNGWLKTAALGHERSKRPSAKNKEGVKVYIKFLWEASTSYPNSGTAVNVLTAAREIWGCKRSSLFNSIDNFYFVHGGSFRTESEAASALVAPLIAEELFPKRKLPSFPRKAPPNYRPIAEAQEPCDALRLAKECTDELVNGASLITMDVDDPSDLLNVKMDAAQGQGESSHDAQGERSGPVGLAHIQVVEDCEMKVEGEDVVLQSISDAPIAGPPTTPWCATPTIVPIPTMNRTAFTLGQHTCAANKRRYTPEKSSGTEEPAPKLHKTAKNDCAPSNRTEELADVQNTLDTSKMKVEHPSLESIQPGHATKEDLASALPQIPDPKSNKKRGKPKREDGLEVETRCSPDPAARKGGFKQTRRRIYSYTTPPPEGGVTLSSTLIAPKLKLHYSPPIWAKSRQEGVAYGYLLGGFSSQRDAFLHNGRLIISHGGGKGEAVHIKQGQQETKAASNQSAGDSSVRSLLANYRTKTPLVLLADERYALFPLDLSEPGLSYVVLGYYWIKHAWAEYEIRKGEKRVIRYKFAFQYCNNQDDPWWLEALHERLPLSIASAEPKGIPSDDSNTSAPTQSPLEWTSHVPVTNEACCKKCGSSFPQIYELGWMCFKPECSSFCAMEGAVPFDSELSYLPDFTTLQPQELTETWRTIIPDPPPTSGKDYRGSITTRRFAKGFHCTSCGRLSSRFRWKCWECKQCSATLEVEATVRRPQEFWSQVNKLKYSDHLISPESGILHEAKVVPNLTPDESLRMRTYILPEGRGRIHVITPGKPENNRIADQVFEDYQRQATEGVIDFRRYPLRAHRCRGELLTNYFSQNCGVPYKYVGGAIQTISLKDGPSAVQGAIGLITKRIKASLNLDIEFNEVLSAAYMELQKMAFHSDSEHGLGPVVASLSLGSVALMHFRVHKLYAPDKNHRKNALSLVLNHGDVLVMEGSGVQEFYEHTVEPMNFRMAATARVISPKNYA